MPSVDVIRNVTIRGRADGVDDATAALNRLTDSIKAANENLLRGNQAANDNAGGYRLTGEGALVAANHLRQAAEAAYAFSPAFRGVVNEMAAPTLAAAGTAITAVAAGIVTATNVTGTGLIALGAAAEKASPSLLGVGTTLRSVGGTLEAFAPTVAGAGGALLGVAGTVISRFLPIVGQVLLLYDGIKLVGQAWELGNQKLAEYVALSEKAAAAGVTTDFFQRIGKAAEEAKLPVDALAGALTKLQESTAAKLGGSDASKAIATLQDYGNFKGNSGVGQLASANGSQEALRAVVSLYDQAVQKGERLAALDAVRAVLGDQIAKRAAEDSGFLDKMLADADAISQKDLVSGADVQRAVELQDRLDAAEKILSQRWHPIQDVLTQLGIKMKEAWVDIVEAIAKAVDYVFTLADRIITAMAPLLEYLKLADQLLSKAAQFAGGALGPVGAMIGLGGKVGGALTETSQPGDLSADSIRNDALRSGAMADARKRLATGLNRASDTSHGPPKPGEDSAAYDRATEALLKYIATTNAAAESVGKSVAEQEKAKAVAQLLAAAEKDGTKVTAEMRAEIDKLAERAGAAALALEKAKVAADIRFNRQTSLLSQEDVQIATQLKGLYPDVATALGSVEAEGIRVNNAMKTLSSSLENELTTGLTDIVSGSKSAGQAFSEMANAILKSIEQMIIKILIVEPLMRSLQSAVSGGFSLGGGSAGATTGIDGLAAIHHSGGIIGEAGMPARYVHPAYFDGAPRFHSGGIAGDEVPIIARKGEGIFTPAQMAAMGGRQSAPVVNVTLVENPNAQGTVTQKSNGNGGIDLQVAIAQIAAKDAAKPGGAMNRMLIDQFGARQRLASR